MNDLLYVTLFLAVNNKLKLLDLLDKINFSRAGKLSTVDVIYERIFEVEMKDATEVFS